MECDMSDDVKFGPPALTFDDVLLLPAHSTIMPERGRHHRPADADGSRCGSRWSPRPWTP